MNYAGNANNYGVTPLVEAGSGYTLIRHEALGAGPVFAAIPYAKTQNGIYSLPILPAAVVGVVSNNFVTGGNFIKPCYRFFLIIQRYQHHIV
jgi:hypothetical protein